MFVRSRLRGALVLQRPGYFLYFLETDEVFIAKETAGRAGVLVNNPAPCWEGNILAPVGHSGGRSQDNPEGV